MKDVSAGGFTDVAGCSFSAISEGVGVAITAGLSSRMVNGLLN